MKKLHLFLKHKWWDMVDRGEKGFEYRNVEYWANRIIGKGYTHVVLHRGYTSKTIEFEIKDIRIGFGDPRLGAPNDKEVIIINLKNKQ